MAKTKLASLLFVERISAAEVSKGTGLGKPHLSMIMNGYQNITMATLKKLCIFLACAPNDILDYEKWHSEPSKIKPRKK